MTDGDNSLREALASDEHARWSRWTEWQFGLCFEQSDGSLVIPAPLVTRWKRQAATPYRDLSEAEKDSDRQEAERILAIVRGAVLA